MEILFMRDSVCYGDDVQAPNERKYDWGDNYTADSFFRDIDDYLYSGLPSAKWTGYVQDNGRNVEKIVDCYSYHDAISSVRHYHLVENWKDLLQKYRAVWFVREQK